MGSKAGGAATNKSPSRHSKLAGYQKDEVPMRSLLTVVIWPKESKLRSLLQKGYSRYTVHRQGHRLSWIWKKGRMIIYFRGLDCESDWFSLLMRTESWDQYPLCAIYSLQCKKPSERRTSISVLLSLVVKVEVYNTQRFLFGSDFWHLLRIEPFLKGTKVCRPEGTKSILKTEDLKSLLRTCNHSIHFEIWTELKITSISWRLWHRPF